MLHQQKQSFVVTRDGNIPHRKEHPFNIQRQHAHHSLMVSPRSLHQNVHGTDSPWYQPGQSRNYYLTALELLVEAQFAGHGDEVGELERFFADADKFPPEEIAKYQHANGEAQRGHVTAAAASAPWHCPHHRKVMSS